MRRHDALIPLTHDHHHALAQVRRLRVAAKAPGDERRAGAKHFLEFFSSDTIAHFREEEEVVLPLVVDAPEIKETLQRVMMQHLEIHARVRKLQSEYEAGAPAAETLLAIAAALERHVRFEEKVVFPLIEMILGRSGLADITLPPRHRAAI